MSRFRSTLDPASEQFAANRDGDARRAAGARRRARARRWPGGGEKYVDRHRQRGKLLARERIELLLDPDSAVPRAVAAGRLGQRLRRRRQRGHRHRRRRGRRVRDHRQRPDGARRREQPVDAEEDAARDGDRAGEPAAADQPGRVRRRGPAHPEGDLHPGRRDLPRPDPAVGRGHPDRSRSSSATPPPAAPTSRACRDSRRDGRRSARRCSSAARRW